MKPIAKFGKFFLETIESDEHLVDDSLTLKVFKCICKYYFQTGFFISEFIQILTIPLTTKAD